jgi:flavin reductase (DIM6/NTAB) family NADH-FMN oxidoreductase RutF
MKIETKPYPLIHPTTIVLVGTMCGDKANFTTIGDIAVAGLNPPLIMISLHENHNATKYINKYNKMTINIPAKNLLKEVDFAGIYSSKQIDKSELVSHEIVDGLPVVNEAPITLFANVVETVQVAQRVIFVCEIYKTMLEESLLKEGHLDLSCINTIMYGLDNKYYSNPTAIGEGYCEGKKIKK